MSTRSASRGTTSAERTTGSRRRSPGRGLRAILAVAAPGRDRLIVWACIALITVLAWTYLLHLDREMSSSMAHDRMMAEMGMTMDMPRTSADLFFTFAMWAVMMIGMMAGPATPMLL